MDDNDGEVKIYAKKSLGQNFLTSQGALKSIVESAQIVEGDIVLEVGPGKGILTKLLLEKAGRVIAVEKDDRLITLLSEMFRAEIETGKFTLVHADILEFDPIQAGLIEGAYKIVANIPYYITGQFLRIFLENGPQPSRMVLMVQKEVAERIVAGVRTKDKESILSISVKLYGEPHYVETVKRGSFNPAPNVDSAILLVNKIVRSLKSSADEKKFFEIVKKGFSHKRKILAQNLEIPAEKQPAIFEALGESAKVRAEDLSIEKWKKLFELLNTN